MRYASEKVTRSSEKQGDELKASILTIKRLCIHFLPLNAEVWAVSRFLLMSQCRREPARSHQGLPTGFSRGGIISSPATTKSRGARERPLLWVTGGFPAYLESRGGSRHHPGCGSGLSIFPRQVLASGTSAPPPAHRPSSRAPALNTKS